MPSTVSGYPEYDRIIDKWEAEEKKRKEQEAREKAYQEAAKELFP